MRQFLLTTDLLSGRNDNRLAAQAKGQLSSLISDVQKARKPKPPASVLCRIEGCAEEARSESAHCCRRFVHRSLIDYLTATLSVVLLHACVTSLLAMTARRVRVATCHDRHVCAFSLRDERGRAFSSHLRILLSLPLHVGSSLLHACSCQKELQGTRLGLLHRA